MSAPTPELFDFAVFVAIAVSIALIFLLWLAYSIGYGRGRQGRSAIDYNRGFQRGRLLTQKEFSDRMIAARPAEKGGNRS